MKEPIGLRPLERGTSDVARPLYWPGWRDADSISITSISWRVVTTNASAQRAGRTGRPDGRPGLESQAVLFRHRLASAVQGCCFDTPVPVSTWVLFRHPGAVTREQPLFRRLRRLIALGVVSTPMAGSSWPVVPTGQDWRRSAWTDDC